MLRDSPQVPPSVEGDTQGAQQQQQRQSSGTSAKGASPAATRRGRGWVVGISGSGLWIVGGHCHGVWIAFWRPSEASIARWGSRGRVDSGRSTPDLGPDRGAACATALLKPLATKGSACLGVAVVSATGGALLLRSLHAFQRATLYVMRRRGDVSKGRPRRKASESCQHKERSQEPCVCHRSILR
jgi:hypothetical protein